MTRCSCIFIIFTYVVFALDRFLSKAERAKRREETTRQQEAAAEKVRAGKEKELEKVEVAVAADALSSGRGRGDGGSIFSDAVTMPETLFK